MMIFKEKELPALQRKQFGKGELPDCVLVRSDDDTIESRMNDVDD